MTKKERIQAVLDGKEPDRVPYAFWSHFPGTDLDPEAMAETTVQFQREYDIDFIKTMNNGMYAVEDFGCEADYSDIFNGGAAEITKTPIHEAADWLRLKYCPADRGSLARELYSLKLICQEAKKNDVPVLFTLFSPVSIANKLCGKNLRKHLEAGYVKEIHAGLKVIAETTADLAAAAIETGADGVFFASQMSSYDIMTEQEYEELGKPYDLQVLERCRDGWFNTVHAHGDNIMFDLLKDYPVQVFNWHVGESFPVMQEAYAATGKCLMGGLKRWDITQKHKNEIRTQIFDTYQRMGMRNHILTPGCVIRHPLDRDMLQYVQRTKLAVEREWQAYQKAL